MRDTSMKAIGALHCSEPGFGQTHESIQHEPNQPDGNDRQQDVGVDQAVVLLPQEAADPGVPVSISLATITSHAMPRLSR